MRSRVGPASAFALFSLVAGFASAGARLPMPPARPPGPPAPVAYEGEALVPAVRATEGKVSEQPMAQFGAAWSRNGQLLWAPTRVGATLNIPLQLFVTADAVYAIAVAYTKAPDYGEVQLSVNGARVGRPLDAYAPQVAHGGTLVLGSALLRKAPAWNQIQFTLVGRNRGSKGTLVGIDVLSLTPAGAPAPPVAPPVVRPPAAPPAQPAPPPAGAPPIVRRPPGPLNLTDVVDKAVLRSHQAAVRPMDWKTTNTTVVPAPPVAMPTSLDYSDYVTFMRVQEPWGGCPGHAMCHTLDILHEFEHPYTPDLSFKHMWWMFGRAVAVLHENNQPLPDAELGKMIPEHGVCTEGMYHTTYDTATPVKAKACRPEYQLYPGCVYFWKPGPSPAAQAEAKLYRFIQTSVAILPPAHPGGASPSVIDVQKLLLRYGPLKADGSGHARCLVGYDDATQQFKLLDNYGEWAYPPAGCNYLAYSDLHKVLASVDYFRLVWSRRTEGHYAYSARIHIQHYWRGSLTVNVGVEGQPALCVWETHGRRGARQHESSGNLFLDVPLPDYAPNHWPPSAANRWFVEVLDHDRDGETGQIVEFTLARRYTRASNHSVGAYQTETFGGPVNTQIQDPTSGPVVPPIKDFWSSNWWWPGLDNWDYYKPNDNPGSVRVHVGGDTRGLRPLTPIRGLFRRRTPAVRFAREYEVVLNANQCSILPGGSVALRGAVTQRLAGHVAGKGVPAGGVDVGVHWLREEPCVNRPDQWEPLITVKTNQAGAFAATCKAPPHYNPSRATYAAAIADDDGDVLASSYPIICSGKLDQQGPKMDVTMTQPTPSFPWQKLSELLGAPDAAVE